MSKDEYLAKIKEAFGRMGVDVQGLDACTKFYDVPGLDSMSIVDFQINLKQLVGAKADEVTPIMDMSLGDFAEILAS